MIKIKIFESKVVFQEQSQNSFRIRKIMQIVHRNFHICEDVIDRYVFEQLKQIDRKVWKVVLIAG